MSPTKQVLSKIQENDKTYTPMEPDRLITDYIQHLQKKNEEAIHAFAENNLKFNLCKAFLNSILSVDINNKDALSDLKERIKEFLINVDNKNKT